MKRGRAGTQLSQGGAETEKVRRRSADESAYLCKSGRSEVWEPRRRQGGRDDVTGTPPQSNSRKRRRRRLGKRRFSGLRLPSGAGEKRAVGVGRA